jgi:hypothetical protein
MNFMPGREKSFNFNRKDEACDNYRTARDHGAEYRCSISKESVIEKLLFCRQNHSASRNFFARNEYLTGTPAIQLSKLA